MNNINFLTNDDQSVTMYVNNIPWITRDFIDKDTKYINIVKHLGEDIECDKIFNVPTDHIDDLFETIYDQVINNVSLESLKIA